MNIDVKRHRRTWWGSYIKPTHCATKIRKNIALIILLSIFGFIDQPYKSKTYPTQPSKNQHMPMTPFSLTAIMFRWWNMIAGQVTSNDWGSRIKLGREVKCLVFVLCFLQTVFSWLQGMLLFLHVIVRAITAAADWLTFFLVGFMFVIRVEMLRIHGCLD